MLENATAWKLMPSIALVGAIFIASLSIIFSGCSREQAPSNNDIVRQVLAINNCYATVYLKQARAEFQVLNEPQALGATPAPTPSFDNHSLRLCYIATVPKLQLNPKVKANPAVLAVGRMCQKLLDASSDSAMAAYAKCVRDGIVSQPTPFTR